MLIIFEVFGSIGLIGLIICTIIFGIFNITFNVICDRVQREIDDQNCYICDEGDSASECDTKAVLDGKTCWYKQSVVDEVCVELRGQIGAVTYLLICVDILVFAALIVGCVVLPTQSSGGGGNVVVVTTQAAPEPQLAQTTTTMVTPVVMAQPGVMMAAPVGYDPNMQMGQPMGQPMMDPNGQPMMDPNMGQPMMQPQHASYDPNQPPSYEQSTV
jgi:hypothetical protein